MMGEKVSGGISSSLAGLSLLSGDNMLFSTYYSNDTSITADSVAVRKAKANFTLSATTPPWKESSKTSQSDSSRISAIKKLSSIIDTKVAKDSSLPDDVRTSFVAYKALDSLRLLSEAASAKTITDSQRQALNKTFLKGLSDLQNFLGQAPSDKLDLAFAQTARRADSVAIPAVNVTGDVSGKGLVATRSTPIPGLTGTERFTLAIQSYNGDGSVTVDLAGTPQPPTLDSVADAINGAIAAVPLRNPDGSVVLDANGNPTPKWLVRFVPDKMTDSWGFKIKSPRLEDVSITQDNAGDALMIAADGQDASGAPRVGLMRLDDPGGDNVMNSLNSITALDTAATARAKMLASAAKPVKGTTPSEPVIHAAISVQASATDASGMTYVLGTSAGDMGSNRVTGEKDLFLSKFDSQGNIVWQKMLGAAGGSEGAALSLTHDGDIVIAGTVQGQFDGQNSDGDMMVARYSATGENEWTTLVRATGADSAKAIVAADDGTVYVGGQAASGAGDAFLARIDSGGVVRERRLIDGGAGDSIQALAIDADGNLLSLARTGGTNSVMRLAAGSLATEIGRLDIGDGDARFLAVGDNGEIAVGGATRTAMSGTQANSLSGDRDGFVTMIDSGLGTATTRYLGTGSDDQIDSLSFMNGTLYAGGRTRGVMGAARTGTQDGFVAAIDPSSATVSSIRQFGLAGKETGAVRLSAMTGGNNSLDALGLHSGSQLSGASARLTANTSLRAGDEFAIKVEGGATKKIVIQADDTLATLAARMMSATGKKIAVTTAKTDAGSVLRIEAKTGFAVELMAGAQGKDALDKLGLSPRRLSIANLSGPKDPKVMPGGAYGLGLSESLALDSADSAKAALGQIKSAISMTQTAYRSLYWDDGKAATVNNLALGKSGTVSAYQSAQLERYQDALSRINNILAV